MPKIKERCLIQEIEIAVLGGGYFGGITAEQYKLNNPNDRVVLLEKSAEIFAQGSTSFRCGAFRLHTGAHYPRSPLTREICHEGYQAFRTIYADLIHEDKLSIYALGITDANGEPPKVDRDKFVEVCNEFGNAQELPFDENTGKYTFDGRTYSEISFAAKMDEPSLLKGDDLRYRFAERLSKAGVKVYCNSEVKSIIKREDGRFLLTTVQGKSIYANYVINATGYQALLPKEPLSSFFNIKVIYQCCTAFVYECRASSIPPSILIMDGAFPSLTYNGSREGKHFFALTHATYSIREACDTLEEARKQLSATDSNAINSYRQKSEDAILSFIPWFRSEFKYSYFESTILAKIDTQTADRPAICVQELISSNTGPDKTLVPGVIYLFPCKISSAVLVAREVESFIKEKKPEKFITKGAYRYLVGGILNRAKLDRKTKKGSIQKSLSKYMESSQLTGEKLQVTKQSSSPFVFFQPAGIVNEAPDLQTNQFELN